jgi:ABC-type arginine/histidine transport system permease subunit
MKELFEKLISGMTLRTALAIITATLITIGLMIVGVMLAVPLYFNYLNDLECERIRERADAYTYMIIGTGQHLLKYPGTEKIILYDKLPETDLESLNVEP